MDNPIYTFWARWVEPPARGTDLEQRRRAQLLALFLLLMLFVFAAVDIIFTLTLPGYVIPWYGYVFLSVSFLLNRRGYYPLASGLAMVMFPVVIFTWVASETSGDPLILMGYAVLGLVLGSILLSMRGMLLYGLLNLAGIMLLPVLLPVRFPDFNALTGPLSVNLLAWLLILLSVHQRRQIEQERQAEFHRTAERLQLALRAARMGTWEWDVVTNQVLWSEHVERIFGLSKGEFDGRYESYLKLVFPDDLEEVEQTIAETLEGKRADYFVQHRIIWPDGSLHWIEGRGRVYRDPNGLPMRMVGTVVDITQHQQADEALKNHAKRLELLREMDRALLGAESPQAIAEVAANQLREMTAYQRVSVALFDFQARQVSFLAVSSYLPTAITAGAVIPMEYYGVNIIEINLRGETYIVEDLWKDEAISQFEHLLTTDHIRAWLCMPLFSHGELIGSLNMGMAEPGTFPETHQEIVREVANQLAITLQQARLSKETQEALMREQRLNRIAYTISSSLDLSKILPIIVQVGIELVDADAGVMGLISSDGQAIEHPYLLNLPEDLGLEQSIPKGQGVAWRVIEHKKGVLLNDYRQEPDALPQWIAAGLRGYIEVPLIAGEACLGILGFYQLAEGNKFSPRDLALAESIGQQAGIVIQNARLFASTQRQIQELTVLHAVAAAGAAAKNEEELLEQIAQIVHEALYPDVFGIGLWDETAQVLRPHPASRGLSVEMLTATFSLHQGVVGIVAATHHPWRVPDVRQEPAYLALIPGVISEMVVPILAGDRLLGVLVVESKQPQAFHEEDERLLSILAGQLAAALERLRAEASLRANEVRRREMLEKIIHLGKNITQVTDLQECLRQIHRSIQTGLGFDRVGIFLHDEQTDLLRGVIGTNRVGEMEESDGFVRQAADDSAWLFILQDPRGIRVLEDYEQVYHPPEEDDMYGVRQHVTLAAWAGDKPVGLIAVDNLISQRWIAAEDIEALQLFAGYVGLAIENARWNARLERRVAERTAQLEAANQELEAFSYSISHDLRTPLRAIDGFAGLLSMAHSAQITPEGQRYLTLIHENVTRMSQLISDLLAFSRLSRQPLHKQTTAPGELARQVVEELSPELAGRQVEIHVGQLPVCQADPSLLRQVFANLMGNAVKYSRPREKAVIEVDWQNENGETVYYVRDNGVGFDMQYGSQLFRVFQRLHGQDFEGTGIGLAIVQRIVHRHGGRVWATAEVDQGATFFFTLG